MNTMMGSRRLGGPEVQYRDWGVRAPRWAGVRSETVDVGGTSVHYLRADASPEAPPAAPVQLLVHGMAASGTLWLDVIRPLTAYGPVVAPDLPGTLSGHTVPPTPGAARTEPCARFLRAFAAALGIDRAVVHGWSLGGLVALRFAALAPGYVARLVLVNPSLPVPLTAPRRVGWQTLGRFGLMSGPALARGVVRLFGRRLVDTRLRYLTEPERFTATMTRMVGGDPSRFSPAYLALSAAQTQELRSRPEQLGNVVTTFASAVSAMYVTQRPALAAVDRVSAPVLLLWGDQDPVITRPVIDGVVARRPDWDLHVFAAAGHLAPLELPDTYVDVVGRWLTGDPRARMAAAGAPAGLPAAG